MKGFVRIGRAEDVPMLEGRTVTVGAHRIAVFRTRKGFHALAAACPHRGGPLADGIVTGSCVTCPLHSQRFDLETGAGIGDHPGVATYEVAERGGELWLRTPGEFQEAA
ncbi:MAG: Rieske 2Fe-2S domain-containing protein [Thermoleophilaceae bacterium]